MNVALWIAAGLLAAAFLAAGAMKLAQPKEKIAASMGWAEDFSANTIKMIGAFEVLGAIGLILPPLVGIAPVLAPLAAVGLVVIMIGAIATHLRRKETQPVLANVVLFALAAFVAVGRFWIAPF
ncbi:MAG: DoxX family protein [Actinobacteria bacterium]|nr:DoxX family protein [Actinomycetota bacterium]